MTTHTYYYAMTSRPLGIGCQPAGHVDYWDENKSQTGFWGVVGYDHALSAEELIRYELCPVYPCICGSIKPVAEDADGWDRCPDCGTN